MNRIPAPKCLHEGCQRTTHRIYCFDHQQTQNPDVSAVAPSPLKDHPQTPTPNFARYTSAPDLWADLLGAFPDIGDVVHPHTIRQEALGTLRAAVDAEAYRRFPALNVSDAAERESLIEQERARVINDLMPGVSNVTGTEARELSHSSSDIFGRSAEDSRYLASYAINAEWECGRILNGSVLGEGGSLEQFVNTVSPQMRDTIDIAFRRNLGDFANIIEETTGRPPLNSDPIGPHLAIALPPQMPPSVAATSPQQLADEAAYAEQAAYVANWFDNNRVPTEPSQQQQQHQQPKAQSEFQYPENGQQAQYQQQAQPEPVPIFSILRRGMKALDSFIMDEDGSRENTRILARKQREEAERTARLNRAAEVDLRLKEELLKQREIRNKKASGWW
jgi:hypothetical protein